jgi:hypothetical protein
MAQGIAETFARQPTFFLRALPYSRTRDSILLAHDLHRARGAGAVLGSNAGNPDNVDFTM